jgi:hypothetical protein
LGDESARRIGFSERPQRRRRRSACGHINKESFRGFGETRYHAGAGLPEPLATMNEGERERRMLSAEENRVFTRVAPGMPMGELLRRY